MTELRPCPFCGSTDVRIGYMGVGFFDTATVVCNECGVCLSSDKHMLETEDAEMLWNRRVEE